MLCQKAIEIMDHALEDAPPEDYAQLQAHLAQCEPCRAKWQALQEVEALLHGVQMVEPPSILAEQIMRHVQYRQRRQALWRLGRSLVYGALIALALAAVPALLLLTLAYRNPSALDLAVELWTQVGWFLSAVTTAGRLVIRILVGEFGFYLLVWVVLALCFVLGWLRFLALAYPKRAKV